MTRKYVRVDLARLRELHSLLQDPVQFAQDRDPTLRGGRADDELYRQHRARCFALGWASSTVKGMLDDAGERDSSSPEAAP